MECMEHSSFCFVHNDMRGRMLENVSGMSKDNWDKLG
jgi:hypothetical protein